MVKPIYFPFTYVPQWVAETLAGCFGQFTVYQPSGRKLPSEMQPWVDANVMEVRTLVQMEDEALENITKEFWAFAGLHDDSKNLKTAAFRGRQGEIPCFNESAASRIVADLKNHSRSTPAEKDPHPLFSAQVFLHLAQEFDRQSAELNRSLSVNTQQLGDLVKEISDAKENDLPATPLSTEIRVEEPGEYMALKRLQAWCRLFVKGPDESGFLVTSSPAVFNLLLERLPAAQKVIESLNLPVMDVNDDTAISRQNLFLERIKLLIEKRESTGETAFRDLSLPQDQPSNVGLTLYRVFGQGLAEICSGVLEDQLLDTFKSDRSAEIRTTLIGLIDRQPVDSQISGHP